MLDSAALPQSVALPRKVPHRSRQLYETTAEKEDEEEETPRVRRCDANDLQFSAENAQIVVVSGSTTAVNGN